MKILRALKIHDRVLLTLCCIGALAAASTAFVNYAGNRLADGAPLSVWQAPSADLGAIISSFAALAGLSFVAQEKLRAYAALLAAAALFFACLAGAGAFAHVLAATAPPAARISLGAAFWILGAVALLAMLNAMQRGALSLWLRVAAGAAVALGFALMARCGVFTSLALTREFMGRHVEFLQQLARHVGLVGAAAAFALIISVPLTALALRHAGARGWLFATLGVVQTIPSIALFGALIAPLSALSARFPALRELGVAGVGPTPAIIALTLYSLPPLVRIFVTGFNAVASEVKDAAIGLGFDRRRLFLSVELPLALPALISGLRVVVIQAIGLAAVAASIGAGGLGVFVFQGIGQYALDLVLLGAIPIILLALAADLIFQMLLAAARRRA
ncbi:putative transporter subunit: permease component of ABC superfamily [Methylocella tundrae]|nr:putative transporter subunit: permease component of ABC superfamily [Methylocella tundrae]